MSTVTPQSSAIRLAERIEAYWKERGYAVRCWAVQEMGRVGHEASWGVRSDTLNGMPLRRIEAVAK